MKAKKGKLGKKQEKAAEESSKVSIRKQRAAGPDIDCPIETRPIASEHKV